MRSMVFLLAMLMAACSTKLPIEQSVLQAGLLPALGSTIPLPQKPVASTEVLVMNDAMRGFVDKHLAPHHGIKAKAKALAAAISAQGKLALRYQADATLTAEQTFNRRLGNCLSFTHLFVAMARYAGLPAHYQQVYVKPSWDRRGNVLVVNRHINVTGNIRGDQHYVVDFEAYQQGSLLRQKVITDEHALAQHFNNLGAQAVAVNGLQQAYQYFDKAISLAPEDSYLWVNLGLLYRKGGQLQDAEQAYLKALNLNRNENSAINNLAVLYQAQGNAARAQLYQKRARKIRQSNPYYYLDLAEQAYSGGAYQQGLLYLAEAQKRKRDDSVIYLAMAKNHQALGQLRKAIRYLNLAKKYATATSALEQYATLLDQAKSQIL